MNAVRKIALTLVMVSASSSFAEPPVNPLECCYYAIPGTSSFTDGLRAEAKKNPENLKLAGYLTRMAGFKSNDDKLAFTLKTFQLNGKENSEEFASKMAEALSINADVAQDIVDVSLGDNA